MSLAAEHTIDVRSAAITVGIHLLLLLLFFFITYQPPQVEPIEEMGIEVNLGTAADGYGTNQPMAIGAPAPDNATATSSSNATSTDIPADILESTDADAPAVNTTEANRRANDNNVNNNNRSNSNRPANNNSRQPQQQARYVYGGSTGPGGNNAPADGDGDNEGNTTGNGDRGVPGGTPGASNYEGTPGTGNGISHDIKGRSIVAFPDKEGEFKEGGRVTVRITVNRQGAITMARVQSSSNSELRTLALKKVNRIRFNKSESAPEEQFGIITFVFKTRS